MYIIKLKIRQFFFKTSSSSLTFVLPECCTLKKDADFGVSMVGFLWRGIGDAQALCPAGA